MIINALCAAEPKSDVSRRGCEGPKETPANLKTEVFCDAECNGHDDLKSISSYTIFFNGGAIETMSAVATTIAKLTMGSEAVAMSSAQDKMMYHQALQKSTVSWEGTRN